jgi:hypothetical protein
VLAEERCLAIEEALEVGGKMAGGGVAEAGVFPEQEEGYALQVLGHRGIEEARGHGFLPDVLRRDGQGSGSGPSGSKGRLPVSIS